ncbi:MAG: GxxExxY protein [Desulfosoma sp.]|uniref:GxxExxY protein n=1 Tax=Desulfosoma sp. TaxID=2603217 RepID=UPI0040497D7C
MATLEPIHEAQVLTCLKLEGWTFGLLINCNVSVLKHGIKRLVLIKISLRASCLCGEKRACRSPSPASKKSPSFFRRTRG